MDTSKVETIKIKDVHTEYEYVKRLRCENCGGRFDAHREGSNLGMGNLAGFMIDNWILQCHACGYKKGINFAVPNPLMDRLLAELKIQIEDNVDNNDLLYIPDKRKIVKNVLINILKYIICLCFPSLFIVGGVLTIHFFNSWIIGVFISGLGVAILVVYIFLWSGVTSYIICNRCNRTAVMWRNVEVTCLKCGSYDIK